MINYPILLGKWYIHEKKTKDKPILFQDFLAQLKSKLVVYHDLYSSKFRNNKFGKIYEEIYGVLSSRTVVL